MEEVDAQLDVLGKSERRVAMATVVATRGTTPKKEGVKMWVREGGRTVGSIGGRIDAKVIAESERVLATGEPRLVKIAIGDEDAWEMGLACGGARRHLPADRRGSGARPRGLPGQVAARPGPRVGRQAGPDHRGIPRRRGTRQGRGPPGLAALPRRPSGDAGAHRRRDGGVLRSAR